jgi:hypothetical protein
MSLSRARVLGSAVLVLWLTGCDFVRPSNPFDPDTPVDAQERAVLAGAVVLTNPSSTPESSALELAAVRVRLLDGDGRALEDDTGVIERTLQDVDGNRGQFVFSELVPDTYTVVVDGVLPIYTRPVIAPVALIAGDTRIVGPYEFTFVPPVDGCGPGSISGTVDVVDAAAGQRDVSLFTRTGGVRFVTAQVSTDGSFSFSCLPVGSYAVVAESDGFTPDYRLDVPVGTDDAPLAQTFADEGSLRLYPISAVLLPIAGDGVRLLDGRAFLSADSAPLAVLAFGGVDEMRLSTDASFLDADGVEVPFVPFNASTAVALPAREGPLDIFAQFRVQSDDEGGFIFTSEVFRTAVVRDVTAPELLSLAPQDLPLADETFLARDGSMTILVDGQDLVSAIDAVSVTVDDQDVSDDAFVDVSSAGGRILLPIALNLTADGEHVVRARVRDQAGNVSPQRAARILLDTVPPSGILVVDNADNGVLHERRAVVHFVGADGGGAELLTLELIRANGVIEELLPDGPFVPELVVDLPTPANGERVTLRATLTDRVGNSATVEAPAQQLSLFGRIAGAVALEGAQDIVTDASDVAVTAVDGAGVTLATTTTDAAGRFLLSDIPESGAVFVEARRQGWLVARSGVGSVAAQLPGAVPVDAGRLSMALETGTLLVDARLAEAERDDAAHAGIVVAVQLQGGERTVDRTGLTDAAGRARFAGLPATLVGESYRIVATAERHRPAETSQILPVGGVTSTPPLRLSELTGAFDICSGDSGPCVVSAYANAARVRFLLRGAFPTAVRARAAVPIDATTSEDELPFRAFGEDGANVVEIASLADGPVDIYVQFRVDAADSGILVATVTKDTQAPAPPVIALQKAALALVPGFTQHGEVDVIVTGSPGLGAPLAPARVLVATDAPTAAPDDAVPCVDDRRCTIPLPTVGGVVPEGLHRLHAFACDQAGNCSTAASTSVIVDRTAPRRAESVGFAIEAAGSIIDPATGVRVLRTPLYTATLTTGRALDRDGNLVQGIGGVLPAFRGYRLSLLSSASDVELRLLSPTPTPEQSRTDVVVPALAGTEDEVTVYFVAVDEAGNESSEEFSAKLRVDLTPPVAGFALAAPDGNPVATTTNSVRLIVTPGPETDDLTRVQLDLDADGDFDDGDFPFPLSGEDAVQPLPLGGDGRVVVGVRLLDLVGNAATRSASILVDRRAPDILAATCATCRNVNGALYSTVPNATETLQVVANDGAGSGAVALEFTINGGPPTRVFSPTTAAVALIPNATNRVVVRSVDRANNVGEDAQSREFTIVHDDIAPSFAVSLNDGAELVNEPDVEVRINGADDDVVGMRLSSSSTFVGPLLPFSAVVGFTLPFPDARRTVFVELVDAAGNRTVQSDDIVLDTVGPAGQLAVAGLVDGFVRTASLGVQATLDGATRFALGVEPFSCPAPLPTAPAFPVVLGPFADGPQTVVGCFGDDAGNVSVQRLAVTVDTTPPAARIALDGGAFFSIDTLVDVVVSDGSDVVRALFTEEPVDCETAALVPFSPSSTPTVALSTAMGDGLRMVTACVADRADNRATLTDSIVLDRVDPTGDLVIAGGASFLRGVPGRPSDPVDANIEIRNAASDVAGIALAVGDLSCAAAGYAPFSALQRLTFGTDGPVTVSACLRDSAGRTAKITDTITVDRVPPIGTVTLNDGIASVTTLTVVGRFTVDADVTSVALLAGDANCELVSAADFAAIGALDPPLTQPLVLLGGGPQTATACFRDAADNRRRATDAINVDLSSLSEVIVIAASGNAFSRTPNVPLNIFAPVDAVTAQIVIDQLNIDTNADGIIDACETGTYTAFQPTATVNGLADGTHTIGVCVRTSDRTLYSEDLVTIDTTVPVGTITLAGGAARTREPLVLAQLTFAADVTAIAVSDAATLDCGVANYETAVATKTVALPGPDTEASNTIRACLRDRAGNTSLISDSIVFDRLPPQGIAVQLRDNASIPAPSSGFLHRRDATARLVVGTGTVEVAAAEGLLDCAAIAYLPATGGTVDLPVVVSAGDSAKTVSACFRDEVGNVASATTSAVLDTANPVGRLVLANGAETTTSFANVGFTVEAPADVHFASLVALPTQDCSTATYQSLALSGTVTLAPGDGPKTVSVCFKDDSGRTFFTSDTIVLDETRPVGTLSLVGNGQAGFTSSTQIVANITAADAVEMALSTNPLDCDTTGFSAFSPSATLTLPAVDGSKTVSLCLKDRAGNHSQLVTTSITLDQTPPATVTHGVTIENGAAFATSSTVTLALTFGALSTDAVERAVQNDGLDCSSATYAALPSTSPEIVTAHTLSPGDGAKVVAVCFRDRAGNTALATDTIVLDTVAPSSLDSALTIDGGSPRTTSPALSLTLIVPGDVDGVAYQEGSVSQAACDAQVAFEAPTSPRAFNLAGGSDGPKTVSACVRERAGRRIVISDSIILDATRPTLASVTLNGSASGGATNNRLVAVAVAGASADTVAMAVADADIPDCTAATFAPFAPTFSHVLVGTDGTKTISVCLKDETGNVSSSSTEATIALDTAPPAGVAVSVPTTTTTTSIAATLTYAAAGVGQATRAAIAEGAIDCATANRGALDGTSPDTRTLTLSGADGPKSIAACFYDDAGNFVAADSATVVLDSRAPTVTSVACVNCTADAGTTFLASTTATLAVIGDEVGSGLASTAQISVDGGAEVARAFSAGIVSVTGLSTGAHTVRVRLADVAGNTTAMADAKTIAFTVDTAAPALAGNANFQINGANAGTFTASTSVDVTIVSPPADATLMAIVESAAALTCATASYLPLVPSFSFSLTGTAQSLRTLQLCLKDRAGNVSPASHSATTTFDSLPPSLPTSALAIDSADADSAHNAFLTTTTGVGIVLDWTTVGDVVAFKVSEGFVDCTEPMERPANIATRGDFTKTDFALSPVDGNKVVFACFKDAAGNAVTASNSTLLDQVGANGSLLVNGGSAFTTNVAEDVTVTLRMGLDTARFALVETANAACQTATLNCTTASYTATSGAVVLDGVLQQTVARNLSDGAVAVQGVKCFEACFEDAAGNRTATASLDGITFDTVAPSASATVTGLSNTAGLTRSPFVTLTLTGAPTDAALMRISEDSGFLGGTVPFDDFTASRTLALSPGDGAKTIHVQLRDAAGNTSTLPINATITLDTQPPSGTVVSINNGATATASATVSLLLQASGASERLVMTQDNDGDTEAYAAFAVSPATVSGTVIENGTAAGDDGTKTVLVIFRDAAGNESATALDTIELDRTRPTVTAITCGNSTNNGICVNAGASATNSVSVALTFGAIGATEMSVATDGCADNEADEPFVPYSPALQALLDGSVQGSKTIAVRFRDAAGNTSQTFVDCATTPGHAASITFDTSPPSGVLVALASSNTNDPAGFSTTGSITATFTRGDATSIKHGQAVDCATASGYVSIAGTSVAVNNIALAGGDGLKTYFACFRDNAGNVTSATASITVDQTTPSGSLTLANGTNLIGTTTTTATLTYSNDTTGVLVQNGSLLTCPTGAGSYLPAQPTLTHTLTANSGAKTVFACLRDAAGNVSSVLSDDVTVDVTPPTLNAFTVNGSAVAVTTRSTTVTLAVDASDTNGPVTMAVANTALSCATASYTSLASSFLHQIPVTSSTTINLCLRDGLGVTSTAAVTRLVNLDQTGPSGTAEVRTSSGTVTELVNTTSVSVRLNLSVSETDVERKVANDVIDCNNSADYVALGSPLPTNVSHTLSTGDGTKTVLVCLRDTVGNVTLVSDTIVLDQTPPSASFALDNGAAFSLDTTVTANFANVTDVAQARFFTSDPGSCPAPFVGYSAFVNGGTQSVTQGISTYVVCLADAAGNTTKVQDSIEVDTTDPTLTLALARRDGASPDPAFTNTRDVAVTITPTAALSIAAGSSVAVVNATSLSCGNATTSYTALPNPLPSTIVLEHGLAAGGADGARSVTVCVKEPSGRTNGSSGTTASIELDTTPPEVDVTIETDGSITRIDTDSITRVETVALAFTPSPATDPLRFFTGGDPLEDCTRAAQYSGPFGTVTGLASFALQNGSGLDDSGTKFAVACFQDRAGNTSAGSDDIFFDEDKPNFAGRPVCANCNLVTATSGTGTFGDAWLGFTNRQNTVDFDVPTASSDVAFVLAMATNDTDQSQPNGLGEDRACTVATQSTVCNVAIGETCESFPVKDTPQLLQLRCVLVSPPDVVVAPILATDGRNAVVLALEDTAGNLSVGKNVAIVRDRVAPTLTFGVQGGSNLSYSISTIDDDGASGTVTMTFTTPHALAVGDVLVVSGVNDGTVTFDGNYTVAQVINGTRVRTAEVDPGADNDATRATGTATQPLTKTTNLLVTSLAVSGETAQSAVGQLGTFRASSLSTLADAARLTYTDVTAPFQLSDNIPVTLGAGDGVKTVFVEFVDNAGNVATATRSATLDATPPSDPQFANATTLINGTGTVTVAPLAIAAVDSHLRQPQPYTVSGFASTTGIVDSDVTCTAQPAACAWNGTGSFVVSAANFAEGENRLRVTATDAVGNTSNADFFIVTKDSTAPLEPTNLVKAERSGVVSLRWTASTSSDVAFYEVLYGYDSSLSGSFAAEGTSPIVVANTQLALTSLTDNNPFLVQVRAVDSAGNRSTAIPTPQLQCIPNPVAPALLGTLSRATGTANDEVVVDGPRAVATRGTNVCLYNIATPTAPTELSCTNPSATASDRLVLHGRHVYLTSPTNALKVATISGTTIGAFSTLTLESDNTGVPAAASSIVHDLVNVGTGFIGIRNNPVDGAELVVLEQDAVASTSVSGALTAAQVLSTNEQPNLVLDAGTRLAIGSDFGVLALSFIGTFASTFTVNHLGNTLTTSARVSAVENPLFDGIAIAGVPHDVVVSDRMIYIGTSEGLGVIEQTSSETLLFHGAVTGLSCIDVEVIGGAVYCADGESPRFVVINTDDPAAPRIVGQVVAPSKVVSLDVSENVVVTVDEGGALRVYELWSPNRFLQGRTAGVLEFRDSFVAGNELVAQAVTQFIDRYDISDPLNATSASFRTGDSSAGEMGAIAPYGPLAVTVDPQGVDAFEIIHPLRGGTAANIEFVSRPASGACSGGRSIDVAVQGNLALVVNNSGKVEAWALGHRGVPTALSPTNVDDTLNGPVTITFGSSHNLLVGEKITVAGSTSFNGTYTVGAVVSSTVVRTVEEDQRVESDTDCSSAVAFGALNLTRRRSDISSIVDGSGTTTPLVITFDSAHSFQVGEPIVVSGVTTHGYNGNYTVASVTSTTVTTTASDPGNDNEGTATAGIVTGAFNVSSIGDPSSVVTLGFSAGVAAVGDSIEILTDDSAACPGSSSRSFNGVYKVASVGSGTLNTVERDSDDHVAATSGLTVERPGALSPSCLGEVALSGVQEVSEIVDGRALAVTSTGSVRVISVSASTGVPTLESAELSSLGTDAEGFGGIQNRGTFGYVSRSISGGGSLRRFTISTSTLTQTHSTTVPVGGLAVAGRYLVGADGTRDASGVPGKANGVIFFVENASAGFDVISRAQALRAPWSISIAGTTLVAAGSASLQVVTVSR